MGFLASRDYNQTREGRRDYNQTREGRLTPDLCVELSKQAFSTYSLQGKLWD